jgi:hypothetical protein
LVEGCKGVARGLGGVDLTEPSTNPQPTLTEPPLKYNKMMEKKKGRKKRKKHRK